MMQKYFKDLELIENKFFLAKKEELCTSWIKLIIQSISLTIIVFILVYFFLLYQKVSVGLASIISFLVIISFWIVAVISFSSRKIQRQKERKQKSKQIRDLLEQFHPDNFKKYCEEKEILLLHEDQLSLDSLKSQVNSILFFFNQNFKILNNISEHSEFAQGIIISEHLNNLSLYLKDLYQSLFADHDLDSARKEQFNLFYNNLLYNSIKSELVIADFFEFLKRPDRSYVHLVRAERKLQEFETEIKLKENDLFKDPDKYSDSWVAFILETKAQINLNMGVMFKQLHLPISAREQLLKTIEIIKPTLQVYGYIQTFFNNDFDDDITNPKTDNWLRFCFNELEELENPDSKKKHKPSLFDRLVRTLYRIGKTDADGQRAKKLVLES